LHIYHAIKLWLLIILIFFVKTLIDSKNVSKIAKNNAKLTAGRVSRRIIAKLCQYVATDGKSENIKEEKFKNPDWLKSDKSIFKDGMNNNKDPASVIEKIMILLEIKWRSFL
jgi:hypothetical protein